MASLKSLLSTLLDLFYSKEEKETVSTLGYSTSSYVRISGWTASNIYFTASVSGWLYVSARSSASNQFLNVLDHGRIVFEIRSVASQQLMTLYVPVVKGEEIGVGCSIPNVSFESFWIYKNQGSA